MVVELLAMLDGLPAPPTRNMAVHVKPAAERALRDGHPWIFADSIRDMSFEGEPGNLAVIFDKKDRFLAVGLYDPQSDIPIKVLQHQQKTRIDRGWFERTLQQAVSIREPLRKGGNTNGYRLVYGENDGLPGFIVDRYADTLVVKLYTLAWIPHLNDVLASLVTVQPCKRLVLRLSRNMQAQPSKLYGLQDGMALIDDMPDVPVVFEENGLVFAADVFAGHKTGFFFDQRENRARVQQLSAGASVLDVFAYSGGFSVYAAAGGATQVLSVDISEPALNAAQHNFALNLAHGTIQGVQHDVMVADAFEALHRLQSQNRKFDVVIIDPPAFAKSQREVDGALAAYSRLAAVGTTLVRSGGTFVMASCSSRVKRDAFFNIVTGSATRPLYNQVYTGHAIDHPVRFAEGEYLKCLFATVE